MRGWTIYEWVDKGTGGRKTKQMNCCLHEYLYIDGLVKDCSISSALAMMIKHKTYMLSVILSWQIKFSCFILEEFLSSISLFHAAYFIWYSLWAINVWISNNIPDSKVHEAYMGSTWGRQDQGGPHVSPMNLAIKDLTVLFGFNKIQIRAWITSHTV